MKQKYRKWDWCIKNKGCVGLLAFCQLNYSLRQWHQNINKARLIERLDKHTQHLLRKGFLNTDDETVNTFIFNKIKSIPMTDKEKEEAKRASDSLKSWVKWKLVE